MTRAAQHLAGLRHAHSRAPSRSALGTARVDFGATAFAAWPLLLGQACRAPFLFACRNPRHPRHAAARLGQGEVAGAEIALLRAARPGAAAPDDGIAAAGIDWPDPADRHVAEAALASGAGLIVTANLRDFPPRATAALGLRAVHPDAFLTGLCNGAPDVVGAAVRTVHARAQVAGGPVDLRDLMRRARLPRLAKAVARAG